MYLITSHHIPSFGAVLRRRQRVEELNNKRNAGEQQEGIQKAKKSVKMLPRLPLGIIHHGNVSSGRKAVKLSNALRYCT